MTFRKEHKYYVFKVKDVEKLPDQWRTTVHHICNLVNEVREGRARTPLECVVVEHDWSIYHPVWALIESEHYKNKEIKHLKRELEIAENRVFDLESRPPNG